MSTSTTRMAKPHGFVRSVVVVAVTLAVTLLLVAPSLLLPRAAALNYAGFLNDGDLLSDEEIATNEVYRDFYRRHGLGYRAGTIIPIPSGDSIAIVMPRHHDNGPVPRDVVSFLDDLRPHLARASVAWSGKFL